MIIHSLRDSISIFPNLIQLKSVWKYSRPSFFPSNGEEITRAKRDKSYQWHTTMHVNTEHVRVISFLFSPGGWRNLFATIRFYDSKFKSRDRRESRAAASMMRRTPPTCCFLLLRQFNGTKLFPCFAEPSLSNATRIDDIQKEETDNCQIHIRQQR